LEWLSTKIGNESLVDAATPSENTVRFYMSRGYELMAQALPELYELEPDLGDHGVVVGMRQVVSAASTVRVCPAWTMPGVAQPGLLGGGERIGQAVQQHDNIDELE